jgi:hypothetical protein
MNEYLGAESTEDTARAEIVKNIYDSSLPLFRRVIESGRVRISFLDYHNVRRAWNEDFLSASCPIRVISHCGFGL